jgi:hypothetical protein
VREETCPFCGARVARERAPKPRSFGHATRAVLAFGAAAATASAAPISACGGESSSSPDDAASQEATSMIDATDAPDTSFRPDVTQTPSYGGFPCTVGNPPQWKAPAPAPGACSAADMSALTTKLNDSAATYADVYAAVSSTCQQCLFSDQASATWQPVVWSPDMASDNAFINFGACYAVVGSAACGKAVQDDQFCLTEACAPQCTLGDPQSCTTTAAMGACYKYETAYTSACGSNAQSLDAQCGMFLDAVNVVCGSGPADGGSSEGGADSGTD